MLTPPATVGPLSWSQEFLWFEFHAMPAEERWVLNLPLLCRVPADTGVAQAEAALAALVARHESLRTTFTIAEDGRPRQVIRAPYRPRVELVPVADHEQLDNWMTAARRVAIDIETQWPLRAYLFVGPAERTLFLLISHVATDGAGRIVIAKELTRALAAPAPPADDAPVSQPLGQVAAQTSEQGRRVLRAGLSHTEAVFSRAPAWMFAGVAREPAGSDGTCLRATLCSRRLPSAVTGVAVRHGVSPSAVYLAAFSAFVRDLHGGAGLTLFSDFVNRSDDASERSASCLFQPALLALPLAAGTTVRGAIRTAHRAMLIGYARARCSFFDAKEMFARIEAKRGMVFRAGVAFNFKDLKHPEAGELAEAPAAGSARVEPCEVAKPSIDFVLSVRTFRDVHELAITASSALVSSEQLLCLIRGVEEFLLTVAADDAAADRDLTDLVSASGVLRPDYGPEWIRVDGCIVNRDQVVALVRSFPGVGRCCVAVERVHDEDRLTAYLDCSGDPPSPAELRRHVVDQLDSRVGVIAPHRFVICRSGPADPTDVSGWRAATVLASGAGLEPLRIRPRTTTEIALWEAADRYAEALVPDVSLDYVTAGGRASAAPAVIRALTARGYGGIGPYDLLRPVSLRHLATKLVHLPTGPADVPVYGIGVP